jgi:protein involved in polysaccharide export with SLBB domain
MKARDTLMRHYTCCFFSILLFAAAADAAIIKTGNVLEINVRSHPEFSGRFVVAESGTIEYPLLADEQIINISTAELMNALTFRLAKYVDNPLVTITIVEKPDITVTVLGVVTKPGPVKTYEGASVQEVVSAAGGISGSVDMEKIKIIHKKPSSSEYFDLSHFLRTGELEKMPKLAEGDVVIALTELENKKIKVIGAVNKPGFFETGAAKTNVFELIYMAGGPSEKGDLSRVRRFFQHEGKTMEEVLDIQSYIDNGQMDDIPDVDPGDVIIVYSKWFDWKTLLMILNNVLLFIVTLQTFGGVFTR